jgi:hypothetical protein
MRSIRTLGRFFAGAFRWGLWGGGREADPSTSLRFGRDDGVFVLRMIFWGDLFLARRGGGFGGGARSRLR